MCVCGRGGESFSRSGSGLSAIRLAIMVWLELKCKMYILEQPMRCLDIRSVQPITDDQNLHYETDYPSSVCAFSSGQETTASYVRIHQ